MADHVLITGGAGFIGSHLADALLAGGHRVRVLDNLEAQVHGPGAQRPAYLNEDVELRVGDVRDPDAVQRSLEGIDVVYHLAAAVGVGQSMYEIRRYTDVNNIGTAVLLEALAAKPVGQLVVASSMSVYGEGLYRWADGHTAAGPERGLPQLQAGRWDIEDGRGERPAPLPTPETAPPSLASVYALAKYDQERLCLIVGRAYGIPTTALRFFNVYGIRQSLSNPYTGVLAIFASRLLNGNRPLVYEDGEQRRDFVSVYDVARACCKVLGRHDIASGVFNVASGHAYSVSEIADRLARGMGREYPPAEITGRYRVGDIRHCFADISRARDVLGYDPQVSLEDGLVELAHWLEGRTSDDRVDEASAVLTARGLSG